MQLAGQHGFKLKPQLPPVLLTEADIDTCSARTKAYQQQAVHTLWLHLERL